ncbi:MAG: hypothetical protein H6810_01480 [Phycisphaeraceae bacterium]|nr:MAG: hypothetical protein H6810_01480 [Phycisphaeraceae bacterium]
MLKKTAILLSALITTATHAAPWPGSVHFIFVAQDNTSAWGASTSLPVPTSGTSGIRIPLSGPGNKHILVQTFKDGVSNVAGGKSYWVKFYVDWGGTGFGGPGAPSGTIGIVGSDGPGMPVPIDEAEVLGGPFRIYDRQTFPSNMLRLDADSLYLTTHQTFRVDFFRPTPKPTPNGPAPIPPPGTLALLAAGGVLTASRRRRTGR